MKLVITIDLDNESFQPDPIPEIRRQLFEVSRRLTALDQLAIPIRMPLIDANGNICGSAALTRVRLRRTRTLD